MSEAVSINGVEYVPKSEPAPGTRAVVVVDRGWVFAGDVASMNGHVRLDRAVLVRRWSGVGFSGMVADPGSEHVTLERMPCPVIVAEGMILFTVPVWDGWGL